MKNKKRPLEQHVEEPVTEKKPSVELVEDQMQIYFRLMKTIPLEVKKSDTVKKVRTEFCEMEGISMVNLKSLSFAGNWLEYEKKLEDYDIRHGSTVSVFLDSGFRIKVHIKISKIGKIITLDVDMRDTILDVKRRIQNKEGIGYAISQQELFYLGEELHDSQTVAKYNIEEGSTIYALFREENVKEIYVSYHLDKRTVNVKVKSWYTIENIKNIIESRVGFPTDKYKVCLNGEELESDKTVKDLGILEGETLRLRSEMLIYVKFQTGKIRTFEVDESHTVQDLKEWIEEEEGHHIEKQRLIFRGRMLEDARTLAHYNVVDSSTIHFMLRLCGC